MVLPSGLQARERIFDSLVGGGRTASDLPVGNSQMRAVPSLDAVASSLPWGSQTISRTVPRWPLKTHIGLPVVASKTAPRLSPLPDARYFPEPREKARVRMRSLCPR